MPSISKQHALRKIKDGKAQARRLVDAVDALRQSWFEWSSIGTLDITPGSSDPETEVFDFEARRLGFNDGSSLQQQFHDAWNSANNIYNSSDYNHLLTVAKESE